MVAKIKPVEWKSMWWEQIVSDSERSANRGMLSDDDLPLFLVLSRVTGMNSPPWSKPPGKTNSPPDKTTVYWKPQLTPININDKQEAISPANPWFTLSSWNHAGQFSPQSQKGRVVK